MRLNLGLFLLLSLVMPLLGLSASAHALNVALVLSPEDRIHTQFSTALEISIAGSGHRIMTIEFKDGQLGPLPAEPVDIVIAAGMAAAEAAITTLRKPVMATLVNTRQAGILQSKYPEAVVSAIVLDQPFERHFRLVRAILPEPFRLAIVLGPETAAFSDELAKTAERLHVNLSASPVLTPDALFPALEQILDASDGLLALPDPVISSPLTARAILLASYRMRRPVFAYSKAFVDAGALGAVYTSPADIGHDTAAWLKSLDVGAALDRLPPPRHPRLFDIAINRRVGRALRLEIADDATLREQVSAGDAR